MTHELARLDENETGDWFIGKRLKSDTRLCIVQELIEDLAVEITHEAAVATGTPLDDHRLTEGGSRCGPERVSLDLEAAKAQVSRTIERISLLSPELKIGLAGLRDQEGILDPELKKLVPFFVVDSDQVMFSHEMLLVLMDCQR